MRPCGREGQSEEHGRHAHISAGTRRLTALGTKDLHDAQVQTDVHGNPE